MAGIGGLLKRIVSKIKENVLPLLLVVFIFAALGGVLHILTSLRPYKKAPTKERNQTICGKFMNFLDAGRKKFNETVENICTLGEGEAKGKEAAKTAKKQLRGIWNFFNLYCLVSRIFLTTIPNAIISLVAVTKNFIWNFFDIIYKGVWKRPIHAKDFTYFIIPFFIVWYYVYVVIYDFTPFSKFTGLLFGGVFSYMIVSAQVWPFNVFGGLLFNLLTCRMWFIISALVVFVALIMIRAVLVYVKFRKEKKEEIKEVVKEEEENWMKKYREERWKYRGW